MAMRSFPLPALVCGQSSPGSEIIFDGKEKAWKPSAVQHITKPYDAAPKAPADDRPSTETTFEHVKRGQTFVKTGQTFVKTGQTMAASFEGGRVMFYPCQPVTAISNK